MGLAGLQIFEKQKLNKVARYWCCAGLLKLFTGALQEHDKERSAKSKRLSPGKKLLQLQCVTIMLQSYIRTGLWIMYW